MLTFKRTNKRIDMSILLNNDKKSDISLINKVIHILESIQKEIKDPVEKIITSEDLLNQANIQTKEIKPLQFNDVEEPDEMNDEILDMKQRIALVENDNHSLKNKIKDLEKSVSNNSIAIKTITLYISKMIEALNEGIEIK